MTLHQQNSQLSDASDGSEPSVPLLPATLGQVATEQVYKMAKSEGCKLKVQQLYVRAFVTGHFDKVDKPTTWIRRDTVYAMYCKASREADIPALPINEGFADVLAELGYETIEVGRIYALKAFSLEALAYLEALEKHDPSKPQFVQ